MSKRCPECHRVNEDSRIFCTYCGATLDAHLRLIQDLEKQKELSKEPAAPWIILGLIVAAAAVWFFLH